MENLAADFIINFNNPIEAEFELSEGGYDCSFELFASGTVWGSISGTLSNQTDLQAALDLKADKTELNTAIQNEAATRAENDTLLQNNINTLSQTVTANYNALDTRITTNTGNISDINTTLSGYGNIVTHNVSEFATSAQGALADTALQPNDNISELVNDVGYITSSALPTDYVPDTRTINGYALSSNITLNYTDVGALSASTTINDLTTIAQQNALNSGATTTNIGQITTNANNISDIQDLIPNQATSSNQLADKDFVNSSIATNTANFIGTFNSVAELEAYTGTLTNNDYAFVATTDAAGNTLYDRYKYNADTQEWLFEYELNNSSFTAQQWASINSGITSGDVTLIGTALQPNDNISELTNDVGYITSASLPTVNNGTLTIQANGTTVGTFTANQAGNTTANIVVPDSATWGNITGTLSNQTDLQNALDAKQDVLTSENAGNCIEIAMGGSSGLPAEYQEVEYLQSSGTQYINTGVVLDDTMTIRIKYDFIRAGFVFGSRNSSSSRYSGITNETGGAYNIRYGNTVIYSQNTTPSGTVDVVISPNGVVLNGEEVSTTAYGDSFYLGNCFLFTTNNNGSPTTSEYAINRIRRFTIDNIIDLVPCKRKSDDVLGMYDLINDEFLTNAGTGTFIAGGDVEEITKISFVNDAGYITGADLPTNHVTTNTAQTISGDKEFTGVTRFQNGSGNGCVILGADVANTTVSTNTRKLGRMSFHTYTNTLDCAFVSTDADSIYNYVEFGGRKGDTTNTSPDILRFTVANSHNSKDKTHALEISYSGGANFTVLPKYNGVNLATKTYVDNGLATKQATLVSGTNIKTINNNSILGSGNLTLDGLPTQTGQSGKFLTTDGTDASWQTVTIPTPTYDSVNERITW